MANDKTEYRDLSHITEAGDVDQSKAPSAIKKLSTRIRHFWCRGVADIEFNRLITALESPTGGTTNE